MFCYVTFFGILKKITFIIPLKISSQWTYRMKLKTRGPPISTLTILNCNMVVTQLRYFYLETVPPGCLHISILKNIPRKFEYSTK